jgi:anthranilate phosphoribosyltransferase
MGHIGECGAGEDVAGFGFHRLAVLRCDDPQAQFHLIVEIANGNRGAHEAMIALIAMIAMIALLTNFEFQRNTVK